MVLFTLKVVSQQNVNNTYPSTCTGSQAIGNFPVYWEIFALLYFHKFCKNIFCKIIEIVLFHEILAMQKFPGIICYNWKLIMAFANARFKYSLILCYTCIYYTFMYSTLASTHEIWNCEPDLIKQHAIHNVFHLHFCHLQHKQLQQTAFPFGTIITEDLIVAIMSTVNICASMQFSNTVYCHHKRW